MLIEPILKLALSMHENPGLYALLIGSGVSTGAGIPTGWEIVLELIRKIAELEEAEIDEGEEEAWYFNRFGDEPSYSKVLKNLGLRRSERMLLLRGYFEPTTEEREQGLKVPGKAHKAIAKIAGLGYIRVILTTNFDPLMETALADEGITPDVISSTDVLKGAIPVVHSRCYVVKLHGDYRDTRIKNMPREVGRYSASMNSLLDRILDDYGLVVCGWSADWDTALRKALERSPNRRFTTFWMSRGELGDTAKRLVTLRRAETIHIESADQAFVQLLEKIESLRRLDSRHPISTKVAVENVKRCLDEPSRRTQLHDLTVTELKRIRAEMATGKFTADIEDLNEELFHQIRSQYEALSGPLIQMLAALGYHGTGENSALLTHSVESLADLPVLEGKSIHGSLLTLQFYPALLAFYASGVAAMAAENYLSLAAIMLKPAYRRRDRVTRDGLIAKLRHSEVFKYGWLPTPRSGAGHTNLSRYLLEFLQPTLLEYTVGETRYEDQFDVFEYLRALTHKDLFPADDPLLGRFVVKYYAARPRSARSGTLRDFVANGLAEGVSWGLLKAGFFGGSPQRLEDVVKALDEWLYKVVDNW